MVIIIIGVVCGGISKRFLNNETVV